MPTSYLFERSPWGFGIDRNTYPPGYRLGLITLRIFADGLEKHIATMVDAERLKVEQKHQTRLRLIMGDVA